MSDHEERPQPACPSCGDQLCGYTYEMHETHRMCGGWGESAEAGGSGWVVGQSLVTCAGCGAKFTYKSLLSKGLMG